MQIARCAMRLPASLARVSLDESVTLVGKLDTKSSPDSIDLE